MMCIRLSCFTITSNTARVVWGKLFFQNLVQVYSRLLLHKSKIYYWLSLTAHTWHICVLNSWKFKVCRRHEYSFLPHWNFGNLRQHFTYEMCENHKVRTLVLNVFGLHDMNFVVVFLWIWFAIWKVKNKLRKILIFNDRWGPNSIDCWYCSI